MWLVCKQNVAPYGRTLQIMSNKLVSVQISVKQRKIWNILAPQPLKKLDIVRL